MIRMVYLGIVCEADAINGAPTAVAASSILLFCRGRIYQPRIYIGSMIRMVYSGILCEADAINGAPTAVAASSILLFVGGGFISPAYIPSA
ncbi:hypothetical protein AB840_11860 [Megasphaera cerevisiae DSM 20462]|uniref:Uncharacterized protein n=1 Tax=Megasphaera cerevisiae DSM 20462 TaxID=1122219 RepID=A0A0J6WUA4_9FIRM|nr:hypothetical protein AB840_11860 [Megasphaera cerevisiae DSM 20462]